MPEKTDVLRRALTDDERRAGIVRLLTEAYINRLKRLGRLKTSKEKPEPLDLAPKPDFLR